MNARYPIWLRTAQQRPGASVFATLYAFESAARGLLSTVITVQALHLLGNVRDVSLAFSAVGMAGVVASFSIPALVRVLSRRWTYTLGAGLLITACIAFATFTISGQILGMLGRVYGTACLNITLSLYILQYIRRSELTISEPRRLQYSALAWTLGPTVGVLLYQQVGVSAPYILSGLAATIVIVMFWVLRLSENTSVQRADVIPATPWSAIGRFVAQPRLRLAWFVVFTRSSWWVFFYIYTAAYAVQRGLGELTGALVISGGNLLLFVAPILGRQAERVGVRIVLMGGLGLCGLATIAAGLAQETPWIVITGLLLGALGAVALDSVGNITFFSAVRAREREPMTTVFRTYIDASEMIPPAMFALLLTWFELGGVYVAQGLFMLIAMFWVRLLPPRLGKRRIVLQAVSDAAERSDASEAAPALERRRNEDG